MNAGVTTFFNSIVQKVKDFWNSLDLEQWSEKIGGTSGEAIQAAIYFGLSFAIGFLFKKYFKFCFLCLIITVVSIKALEYNGFITIDMEAIKTALGMAGEGNVNTLLNAGIEWIKGHLLVFVSSFVGFLVGYKLG